MLYMYNNKEQVQFCYHWTKKYNMSLVDEKGLYHVQNNTNYVSRSSAILIYYLKEKKLYSLGNGAELKEISYWFSKIWNMESWFSVKIKKKCILTSIR